jgi:hypothetical protein
MKTVINKNNGKKYDVYDVTYDKAGYPHFLVYKDEQWVRMSAKYFRPYTAEDYYKDLADMKYEYERTCTGAETTLYFDNYDC